jgi:hypothetical protein
MRQMITTDADGRLRLPDRLFELLVDIHDEGPRSVSEARFYAFRSFLPQPVPPREAIQLLRGWLETARDHGWLSSDEAGWPAVDRWLAEAEHRPRADDLGSGPDLVTTAAWHDLQVAERAVPAGNTAWTWPEGWDRPSTGV